MTKSFKYELIGTGWAKFSIINESNTGVEFVFSYLSDPLADLLESLNKLLKNDSSLQRIDFPQEPGEIFLFLRNEQKNLTLEIYYNDDLTYEDDNEKILRDFQKSYFDNDTLLNFSKLVYEEINSLFKKYGEIEYKEKWVEYDFPLEKMEELEKLIKSYT